MPTTSRRRCLRCFDAQAPQSCRPFLRGLDPFNHGCYWKPTAKSGKVCGDRRKIRWIRALLQA